MDNYNDPVAPADLGDGLFLFGSDLFCTEKLLSMTRADNVFTYEYPGYFIRITASGTGNSRSDFHWQRIYKEEG